MIVTLYMAVSADGYIARVNDDTDWVCDTDWDQLEQYITTSDAVIMGRKTYEVSGEDFPYGAIPNIVLTSNKSLTHSNKQAVFTPANPSEIIEMCKEKNYQNVLIIGGGKTNSWFLSEGLIDTIVLSVHPKVLGSGIKVFEDIELDVNLGLSDVI
jgi:dihydrofolate reductase